VTVEFYQVDVFAEGAYLGNPLAVFPDASDLTKAQMQRIAKEMNLSETTFVSATEADGYTMRIFTPDDELPFAGHPTIGTAWLLRHLGKVTATAVQQTSPVGLTPVVVKGDELWFERSGQAGPDLEDADHESRRRVAEALGLDTSAIGLEARELGRPGRLRPAFSNAGVEILMVPLKDLDSLAKCSPRTELLSAVAPLGAYCFTAHGAGRVRARGFFPGLGISEDPATGSAAADLGVYLADRIGAIQLDIQQGVEMGRASRIKVRADAGKVEIGGRCELILHGELDKLPG
jgi:trans-2,3-dihydro-3-hydroxyanthranilate isomerase